MRKIITLCSTLYLGFLLLWGQGSVYNSYNWRKISREKYIATDFKGNKHDIQQLLRQGKKILIDFSATWCNPCWNIHTNHFLENLDKEFGPTGKSSQDLVILWVEATGASEKEIRNPSRDWTMVYGTQEEVSYPIISDARLAGALGIIVSGYPTVAFISPSGEYTNLFSKAPISNIPAMRALLESCPEPQTLSTPPTAGIPTAIEFAYTGENIQWMPKYTSDSPITSFEWEFQGAREKTSSLERPSVVWDTPGSYKVKFTITNKFGTATSETNFVVYDGATTQFPLQEKFEDGAFPTKWRTLKMDRDNQTWINIKTELDRLGIANNDALGVGYNSSYSLVSWSFSPTKATPKAGTENEFTFEGETLFPNNWLISPPINIPNEGDITPLLTFSTSSFFIDNTKKERYRVYAAIGPAIKASDFVYLLEDAYATEKPRTWNTHTIDLSKFKGERISLAFVHKTLRQGPGVLLDDITITLKPEVAIQAPEAENVRVYPTVADQKVIVECAEGATVMLLDMQGRQIFFQQGGATFIEILTDKLSDGNYFVRIIEQSGATKILPIIIQH